MRQNCVTDREFHCGTFRLSPSIPFSLHIGYALLWVCSAVGGYFQWALDVVLRDERTFTAIYANDIQVGANSAEELKRRIVMPLKVPTIWMCGCEDALYSAA